MIRRADRCARCASQYTRLGSAVFNDRMSLRMTPDDPTSLRRSPHIRSIANAANAVPPIAELLDCDVDTAPFRLPSATVWQMTVPGTQGRPVVMLTFWPGIRRVDVISGPATVVFTDIHT